MTPTPLAPNHLQNATRTTKAYLSLDWVFDASQNQALYIIVHDDGVGVEYRNVGSMSI